MSTATIVLPAPRDGLRKNLPFDDSASAGAPRRAYQELEALVRERTAALEASQRLLRTTLEHLDQGLVLLDAGHIVRLCNPRALELLRLPESVLHENAAFADIRAFQNARGDFALMSASASPSVTGSDPRKFPLIYDWPRPDGTTLEVRRVQLDDGSSVNTFTDVTERRAVEAAVRASEHLHRKIAERTEEMAQTDELTGVLSRRYILRALSEEMTRAQRTGELCAVAMMDLDFFKGINDRFGHPVGDEVLRSFAIAMSAGIRNIDRLGRYGGEEFLLILPNASLEQATSTVDRLRQIIAELDWSAISEDLAVTVSAGVTQVMLLEAPDEIIARADAALYRAKQAGRNRVTSA